MDYSKYVQGQGHQAHLIAIVARSLRLISYGPICRTGLIRHRFVDPTVSLGDIFFIGPNDLRMKSVSKSLLQKTHDPARDFISL